MRDEGYKGSVFCLVMTALVEVLLVADLDSGSGPAKARGLAVVQYAMRWLLVETLGMFVAVMLVMVIGIGGAAYFWSKK